MGVGRTTSAELVEVADGVGVIATAISACPVATASGVMTGGLSAGVGLHPMTSERSISVYKKFIFIKSLRASLPAAG
jgi:hypothetical protein